MNQQAQQKNVRLRRQVLRADLLNALWCTLEKQIKALLNTQNRAGGANVLPQQPTTSLAPASPVRYAQLHLHVFRLPHVQCISLQNRLFSRSPRITSSVVGRHLKHMCAYSCRLSHYAAGCRSSPQGWQFIAQLAEEKEVFGAEKRTVICVSVHIFVLCYIIVFKYILYICFKCFAIQVRGGQYHNTRCYLDTYTTCHQYLLYSSIQRLH